MMRTCLLTVVVLCLSLVVEARNTVLVKLDFSGLASSFNGVKFGVAIDEYGTASPVDNSNDRRVLEESGTHKRSFQATSYRPQKVFRRFSAGEVRASWSTKVVYAVVYRHQFERTSTTALDREELKQTYAALVRKYGSASSSRGDLDGTDDCWFEFTKDDLVVRLEYTSEGRFDRGAMELTASSRQYAAQAERESRAYYKERLEADRQKVQSGGEDAL